MTGGWGAPRKSVTEAIQDYADDLRKRSRRWEARPPSNDPQRPPQGPASGSLANPRRVRLDITITDATAEQLADAPDSDD